MSDKINFHHDDKFLAKSYQDQKDWQKLNELEKIQESQSKIIRQNIKSRNQKKISSKTFKMKSHILLPSKVLSTKGENLLIGKSRNSCKETKEEEKKAENAKDLGDQSPPFEISKEKTENVIEFSKAIEDFNKDLIDDNKNGSDNEEDHQLLFHNKSELVFDRSQMRANINSVIEKDDLLLDSTNYKDPDLSAYSIGDDLRMSNGRSEISDTTKNINASFDDDKSNRREEIEAAVESLEFKAMTLVNDDEQIFKLCQDKMKDYFEK